jgi:hypothetical protein
MNIEYSIESWHRPRFAGHARSSPLIERYTRPGMGRIWTEENKYRCWLQVESAANLPSTSDLAIITS